MKPPLIDETPQSVKDEDSAYYLCSVCNGDKKLEINWRKKAWYCHKCGTGGFFKSGKKLGTVTGSKSSDFLESGWSHEPIREDSPHHHYLSKVRKFSSKMIADLRPCYGPAFLRVYFPFYDLGCDTTPVYMVGRHIFEDEIPYMNPPTGAFPKRRSEVLWGLHRIKQPVTNLVVCEGIFDALWAPNRVALLGKTASTQQLELMIRLATSEITIMLDGDARKEASWLAMKLGRLWEKKISIVPLLYGEDPDMLGEKGEDKVISRVRVV